MDGVLSDDFNFNAHITVPSAIDQFELPLTVHITENINIENFNNNSILQTVNAKSAPTPHPDDLDIGSPLKSPLQYTSQEFQDLVRLIANIFVTPLAHYLLHSSVRLSSGMQV